MSGVSTGNGTGVRGEAGAGTAIYGVTTGSGYAGYFQGRVNVNGTFTNNSDVRLKQSIQNLGYGLRELLQLRPVTWRWKDRTDTSLQFGLIAQEVEPIMPELTRQGTDPAKLLSLNYLGFIPIVVKAIQEQQTALDQKNAEINALKTQNTALQERLKRLEQTVEKLLEATTPETKSNQKQQ